MKNCIDLSERKMNKCLSNIRHIKNRLSTIKRMSNIDECELPILKIDFKGRILYANQASFPLIKALECAADNYLPESFILRDPRILDLNASFSFIVELGSSLIYFDVIGFEEYRYIGLYGYKRVEKEKNEADQNSIAISLSN